MEQHPGGLIPYGGNLAADMRHPHRVISLAATGANLTTREEAFAPGLYRSPSVVIMM